ncbi:MAG: aldo/keto reductase, partial [bacterium]
MKYRKFGRTGLQVSEVSLGFAFTSEPIPVLTMALDAGINLVDTAAGYGDSEDRLGTALKACKRPIMVETKFGGRPWPFNPKDKAALRKSFEDSLKNLNLDSVDILMIHEPDRPGQYDWYDDYKNFTGPVTELMQELKDEGLIKFLGLGGTTAYEMANVMDTGQFDVVLSAFNYSLLWREAEQAIIPVAKKHDIAVICASPLQQGWLIRRWDDEVNNGASWLS